MNRAHLIVYAVSSALTLPLAGCGGGGDSPDMSPSDPPIASSSGGPDSFLLFPNPLIQPDGTPQTNSLAYSQAYYAAIDPTNAKDTLAKWKAANGFDGPNGVQLTAVFGDRRDLGYGRRMTARKNMDGTIAFLVENYLVSPGVAYEFLSLSLEAAVVQDLRWRATINAIEFSPGPGGGQSFVKFFNFHPTTGQRELTVDLDARGPKAMPGPCLTCHGGRGDPLTPPDDMGKRHFGRVANAAAKARGDAQARLAPFEVDTFEFSTAPGFTRASQETVLKEMNKLVLCTYPKPESAASSEDACRPNAVSVEWQGAAAELIKAAYGGNELPSAKYQDTFLPSDWAAGGQKDLYEKVVARFCRGCHILRGTGLQSDIDLMDLAKFGGYADRIKAHVFDRGNMPLAKIIFDTMWAVDSSAPGMLATFLEERGFSVRDASNAVPRPGRPVADPGPDRIVARGSTTLSAAASLFANAYSWRILSGPDGATPPTGAMLSGADSQQPTFSATVDGRFVLQLVASNGSSHSAPATLTLLVRSAVSPAPRDIRFADVKGVLRGPCISCHNDSGSPSQPPLVFGSGADGGDIDRNGDRTVDDRDDAWFYEEVRGRINFTDVVASPILRKPSGSHHNGGRSQVSISASLSVVCSARATTCSSTGSSTARLASDSEALVAFHRDS